MSEDTYRVALVRAAQLVGGARALSDRLRVPMPDLTRGVAGDGQPPMGIFLRVVEILIEERDKPKFIDRETPGQASIKPHDASQPR